MITPNRSENNMRRVDLPDIERIVRDTFGKYILI
jgi:hypothetical protein